MSPRRICMFILIVITIGASACRPELGPPDYSSHEGFLSEDESKTALPGEDPFVEGDERLAFGIFYEGGASDIISANGVDRHYYIFVLDNSDVLTYAQDTVSDRVEGEYADRFTLTGTPWWGGGLIWDSPTDLSQWTTLHISLMSSSPSLLDTKITLASETSGRVEVSFPLEDYGFVADGEWHTLKIPLQDFVDRGLNLNAMVSPLILSNEGGNSGDQLLIDAFYYTTE